MGVHRGLDILEIGCGPGYFTIPTAKMAEDSNVYALDLSPLMIKNVKKKVKKHGLENVKTITSTANNTGLDDESIDLIFCIDVLSDITDIDDTLREMHRILKSDGTLSVFEPHAGFEPGAWKPEKSMKILTSTGLFSLHE